MAIQHFFNKSIVIKRLESAGGFKKVMVSTGTVDAHIQRIDDVDVLQVYGVAAATHKAWVDISTNINEGDMVISDDYTYDVVGVSVRGEGIAINEHKEIILNINNEYRGTP